MLMEYLAEAILEERRAEFARCAFATAVQRESGHRGLLSRLFRRPAQEAASRPRSAASTAGHSLSMME